MAVNRYQPHLVVYLEDRPYREIMNGVKNLPVINANVVDVRPPAGGWAKVFETLTENIKLLDANPQMHALLLMDFDNDYAKRMQRLNGILSGHPCAERVFMLGIDDKESEDLKKSLKCSNSEAVASVLLKDCPAETGPVWKNSHLHCNGDELQRMRENGVLRWLFR